MNKTISQIDITFENVDYVVIPYEYFQSFLIENVVVNKSRKSNGDTKQMNMAGSVSFVLKSSADKQEDFKECIYTRLLSSGSLFDRILQNDISILRLIYTDGTTEDFYPVWEDDGETDEINILQKSSIDTNGNLIVRISKY